MDATAAYGSILGDSNNSIGEYSCSLGGVSYDLVDNVAHGDSSKFHNSGRVGSAYGDSNSVGYLTGVGGERDESSKIITQVSSASKHGLDLVYSC